MECRLIGSLPGPLHHILPFLKGRLWHQLPADVQARGNQEPGITRRKPKKQERAIQVNEFEWQNIQKCWKNQSPGLVLINGKDQLQDVVEITGDHTDGDGIDFGTTFNFAVDITGASPEGFHLDDIYNETRRHFLLAKSSLRQIKILHGQIPRQVSDDFADLEITLDEFFMGPPSAAVSGQHQQFPTSLSRPEESRSINNEHQKRKQ
jgi:hypothetical protein